MKELRPIKDFPGYFVSDSGDVYSKKNSDLIKLKAYINKKNGYAYVSLCKNNKIHKKSIHRLVAQEFIPNLDNKSDVNHISGIKTDNKVNNLEWATRSENMLHNFKVLGYKGGYYRKFGKDNPKAEMIIQLNNLGEIIAEFYGSLDAQRKTGIYYVNIWQCCNGKRKSAGGYQWKYKTKE